MKVNQAKLEELKRNVTVLKQLLDDPHPGLMSWSEAYAKHLKAVSDFYTETPDFVRASGDCVCPICGQNYYDHPMDLQFVDSDGHFPLNRLCDGDLVKL